MLSVSKCEWMRWMQLDRPCNATNPVIWIPANVESVHTLVLVKKIELLPKRTGKPDCKNKLWQLNNSGHWNESKS